MELEMKELELEYRMYGFVPYNLSEIQKGIQFGHAVVEYGQNVKGMGNLELIYNKWANHDKTFIILNGGTTNNNVEKLGSLNLLKDTVSLTRRVPIASFNEPDLGDQLTAFVFLVDERVWNKEKYPDFVKLPYPWSMFILPTMEEYGKWVIENDYAFAKWIDSVGGEEIVLMREFLAGKRLA